MNVYRIETNQGNGPFGDDYAMIETLMLRSGRQTHTDDVENYPNPWFDKGFDRRELTVNFAAGRAYCGVIDLEGIDHWFPEPVRIWMAQNGYRLAVYRCADEDVLQGDKQVLFLRSKADLTDTLDIITLEPKGD
ncbi:hypothetical protein [Croceicoccus naphthovorans]|uniref:Uncharacterized protein n=1 Tax=Croceicoccus naphthovorans TaxID=1348774 RepID=A0A0G3XCT6_9SPHN|nr:hypothetical protein [Croceicoccus naphthovorans]AKM09370.1 hypothetical protein AB433_04225 [Croceicoccus naphthovorans]MBB3990291.1 hypothetical protein [Croceicoccus naphthovorans]